MLNEFCSKFIEVSCIILVVQHDESRGLLCSASYYLVGTFHVICHFPFIHQGSIIGPKLFTSLETMLNK